MEAARHMHWLLFRFLLIGPAVGAFAFVAVDQALSVLGLKISTLAQVQSATEVFVSVPLLWLYSLLVTYPIGALPSLATGATYAFLISRGASNPSCGVRAFFGGVLGLVVSGIFGATLFLPIHLSLPLAVLPWAAAGALGGASAALSIGNSLFSYIQSSRASEGTS
jgi:hypothetical protein